MQSTQAGHKKRTMVVATMMALLAAQQQAFAGPGIAPVYSANAAPPPSPPDTFANTYYANSPSGLRTDLVANPLNPIAAPTIDTGAPLRKFVDVLPGIQALAPSTNIGTGTTGGSAKYIPLAVPATWPTDGADYYHIAVVEYTEQLHSDLPKASVLRGYVQIEEPGQSQPAGSKHIALSYPNGSPITLPDASGVQHQVYAYDNPHYLGPAIQATKGKPVRVKYSNLLPVGDATGLDPWGNALGNGVAGRNGDLPLPVDATLAGGALPQNRIDIHLHGGFTPWISDGNPHQWTLPVGDNRYSYLSDIAVTSVGSGYTAPVVTIDPPQANATATAQLSTTVPGSVGVLQVTNPGAFYTSGAIVTLSTPPGFGTIPVAAKLTDPTVALGKIGTTVTMVPASSGPYLAAPAVTISAPTPSVNATATATASATAGSSGATLSLSAPNSNNVGYATAPAVTIAAPPAAVPATVTLTPAVANGALTVANNANYGYWTAPAAPAALPAPPAAVNATATAAVAANAANGNSPQVTAITVNAGNFGYWPANNPTVTLSAPPAAVAATLSGAAGAGNLNNNYAGSLGSLAVANRTTNFGYWNGAASNVAGSVISVSAPQALTPTTLSYTVGANGTITALSVTTAANFGYNGNNNLNLAGLLPAAPAAVAATVGTVTLAGGKPTATVTNAASNWGYFTAPTVTLTGGTHGTGTTTATATIANGRVTGITYTGTAVYTAAPTISIAAPAASRNATLALNGGGAGGVLTASVGGNTVLNLGNAGRNYAPGTYTTAAVPTNMTSVQAVVTPTVAAGRLTGLTLSTAGSGYTPTHPLTVTVGAPTPSVTATATPVLGNGKITGFTISGGANYAAAPTVTISAAKAGTQATWAAPTVNGAGVVSYALANPGAGYASAPAVTTAAPTASVTATATATVNGSGQVTGFTLSQGANYLPGSSPVVTIASAPAAVQATATANWTAATGNVTGITVTNPGYGYWSPATLSMAAPVAPVAATATALLDANGSVIGFNVTNPGAGYVSAPTVTIAPSPVSIQATATATQSGGALTGVTITNPGRGYLTTPNVTVTDPNASATGGVISALVQMPVGPAFRQVPDMAGNIDASKVPAGYVAPIIGEGTLYYTNQQSERMMWYHDHTSGTTRLNVYEGLAAPYLLTDPAVDPAVPGATTPGGALDGYVPREQIALVIQDKTFVPKDIAQQDANWDTSHWGQYGDLWYPHVYETNQNPAFLHSLSNLGRWDWGPWFAIVYPALYALPSGKYGDVTLTPEAYEDTALVNGVAYPEVTVDPKAYRFRLLNAANDRFLNLGFYVADTTQPASFTDALHAALGVTNYPEVEQFLPTGAQPTAAATLDFTNQAGAGVSEAVAPNVFQGTAFTPWPMDGGAAGPGANHIVPAPTTMGPPMISIGNEGGLLPRWVQHDAVPANYDYNRRSATVLNLSQNNDYTQQCYPECHGLYIGPAERADFVVDFAPYAGKTLILYNDGPAPNPGYDTRIDYYTGNDPTGNLNYMTGGAPSTQPGYGPSTRTVMQVVVRSTLTSTVDYTAATKQMPAVFSAWNPTAGNLVAWNPNALGGGAVLGVTQDASGNNCQVPGAPAIAGGIGGSPGSLATCVPGVIQTAYAATQGAPIVGESAYNIAFNPTTAAANAAKGLVTSTGGYADEYGNMYLGSQNQPEFYVTNPGPLKLTGLVLTGQTSTSSVASGTGVGPGSSGTNANAGAGTGYFTVPGVVIAPPTACTPSTGTTQNNACVQASGHATIGDGGKNCGGTGQPACNNIPVGQVASVVLDNPGAGYTEVPAVTIVSGGTVSAVSITNAGSGYTPGATLPVTFSAPACVNQTTLTGTVCVPATASGTATVGANGSITGITITSAGNNYSTPPTVTLPAPVSVAASATTTVSAGAVTGLTVTSPGVYASGTVPTVTFSAPPAASPAVIVPTLLSVGNTAYDIGFTISSPGAGYTTAPTITTTCNGAGTTTLNSAGGIASVLITAIGSNCTPSDVVTLSTSPVSGVQATGTAVMDSTGTTVASVSITNPGSGYSVAPTVTFSGGVQATASAAVAGGGYGATAIAVASTTQMFIAPAAIPGNVVPPNANATPMTLTPAVASMLGCNAAQTVCTNLNSAVVGRLMNPAIQELFEPFYGRMNATLGIEMPNQSLNVQTTLPLNYVDPATEVWEYNKPVMWKVTHNGVDAHPVHIHLVNAQLVNRVGWDGTVKQPEDDEIGWKEVIKMNPLEDIILAMVPTQPPVPFGLDRSVRPEDPSQPLGVNLGFTQYSVNGFNGAVGQQGAAIDAAVAASATPITQQTAVANLAATSPASLTPVDTTSYSPLFGYGSLWNLSAPAAGSIAPASLPTANPLVGVGDTATIVNAMESYDNEYVWHCHILGHEENDFMRPITTISSVLVPPAPGGVAASQSATGAPVTITWVDPTPVAAYGTAGNATYGNIANELGFLVERSFDGGKTWSTVTRVAANSTSATDPIPVTSGQLVTYRVVGYNAAGAGAYGAVNYTGL